MTTLFSVSKDLLPMIMRDLDICEATADKYSVFVLPSREENEKEHRRLFSRFLCNVPHHSTVHLQGILFNDEITELYNRYNVIHNLKEV